MLVLDHLAVACSALEQGVASVEASLGVKLEAGGKHALYGTHNMLLGLADGLYLEVIAKDPDAAPFDGPSWFGLEDFSGMPRLANWICRTDQLHALLRTAPTSVGKLHALQRDELCWQITVPDDGSLPFDGAFPTLIQWGDGVHHPANALPDSGCRLKKLVVTHPDAKMLSGMMDLCDDRVELRVDDAGFLAIFDTPNGERSLS